MPNGPIDVAAGAPNAESYTINGDGTVVDNVTALMWQQANPSTMYTWADAAAYCTTLTIGGHDDWRLPTRIELVSIVDEGVAPPGPAINTTAFPGTPAVNTGFWSATPVASAPTTAYQVGFYYGNEISLGVTTQGYVRCVR